MNGFLFLKMNLSRTNKDTGYYMLLDDQSGQYGYAALRNAYSLKPTSPTCTLEFYFYMFGYTDDLRVYLVIDQSYTEVAEYRKDFGTMWNKASVNLGRITKPFKLEFEGSTYSIKDADVAIDDISMVNCAYPAPSPVSCPSGYFTCQNKVCIKDVKVCDLTDDCGDGSDESDAQCQDSVRCDFESKGLCDWSHDPDGEIKWEVKQAYYSYEPTRDHTTGTSDGHYLQFDNYKPVGHRARILSPILVVDKLFCDLRFYYFIFGSNVGQLRVLLRTTIGGDEKVLFSKDKEESYNWQLALIEIQESRPFQIVIEGMVGISFLNDIAIDDVSFTSGCKMNSSVEVSTITTERPSTTPTTQPLITNHPDCPENFCLNNGICYKKNTVFKCQCPSGYIGERCQVLGKVEKAKSNTGLILGILIPCVVFIVIIVGLVIKSRRGAGGAAGVAFNSNDSESISINASTKRSSTSIPNPLFK